MAYVPLSLPLGIYIIVFINIISVLAGAPPNKVALALQPRATFAGGYALSEQQCPSGTISCGGTSHSCCPANAACRSGAVSEFCCPSESDCTPTVKSFPVCADPSWVLYNGKVASEHFCCQPGEQGIHPGPDVGGVGLCVASDMSVAVTQTAFEYTSAPGSLSTSGLASSTGTSSALVSNSASASTAQSTSVQSTVVQTTATQSPTASPSSSASSTSSGSVGSTNLLAEIAVAKAIGAIGVLLMVYL